MFTAAIICLWICVPMTIRLCSLMSALQATAKELHVTPEQLADLMANTRGYILWAAGWPLLLYVTSVVLFVCGTWQYS